MRKKTLRTRIMCGIVTLVFLASLFQVHLPVEAANTATIPITVGGKTFNVTPGQWVTVNTPGGTTSYNVRFVDGRPVALEMSQYQQIVFGDAASAAGATSGSTSGSAAQTGNTSTGSTSGSAAQTGNTSTGSTSGSAAQTGNTSTGSTSGSTAQTSVADGATTSTGAAQTPSSNGNMTWNDFQKANAGKGMSSSEMSQAWKDYKAGNTGSTSSSSSAAQTGNTSTGATSGNTTQASVAEGTTPSTSTSGSAAQSGNASTGAAQTSVADGSAAQTSQNSSQSNWNPAKHPRDPQTGKFISHEEAIARGLMDPADASTTSSNSSNSSQTTQTAEASQQTAQTAETSQQASQPTETTGSTETAQASTDNAQAATGDANQSGVNGGESANAAQAAQAGSEGAASGEKTKTSIGDKFKAGYQTGKNLTQQGFQNVKDSLKSGFSAKNILVTAGITVGVDLATQVMRGEKPSLKSALKTVCSAEFVGSLGGSVLGAATGSFFVPFLSCIPVVGGALSALAPTFGSVVGSSVGAYVAGDLRNGRFSIKEAFKRIDWVGVTGQTIGSTVGAALGSCLGPVGTVIGGMAGGYLGNWAAHKIAGMFGKGEADLPTISMPTGGTDIVDAGTITLGGDDVTSVTISDNVTPGYSDDDDEERPQEYASINEEITAAYEEYTEYYTEYSKLIQAGKTEEALEVADKMNEAKAKYDALRSRE